MKFAWYALEDSFARQNNPLFYFNMIAYLTIIIKTFWLLQRLLFYICKIFYNSNR